VEGAELLGFMYSLRTVGREGFAGSAEIVEIWIYADGNVLVAGELPR
jgi:hypothetical protein